MCNSNSTRGNVMRLITILLTLLLTLVLSFPNPATAYDMDDLFGGGPEDALQSGSLEKGQIPGVQSRIEAAQELHQELASKRAETARQILESVREPDPGPDMCEYQGVLQTCADAWAQYEVDLNSSSSDSSGASAGSSGGQQSQPYSQGQVRTLVPEMARAAAGFDTKTEGYRAALEIWEARDGSATGTLSDYDWLLNLSNLATQELSSGRLRTSALGDYCLLPVNESGNIVFPATLRWERTWWGAKIRSLRIDDGNIASVVVDTQRKKGTVFTVRHNTKNDQLKFGGTVTYRFVAGKGGVVRFSLPVSAFEYVELTARKGNGSRKYASFTTNEKDSPC